MPTPPCSGQSVLFFAEDEASVQAAKRICSGCEWRVRCLAIALRRDEPAGVWGGTTAEERRRITLIEPGKPGAIRNVVPVRTSTALARSSQL